MEGMFKNEFRISEISNKPFCPFEINQGIEVPLIKMDPDVPFYSESHYIRSLNCDYYLEEKIIKEIEYYSTKRNHLSFFNLDIKSLPTHYDELEMFLKSLGHIFFYSWAHGKIYGLL